MGACKDEYNISSDDLKRLRDSETRYRRLFETTQDGILILDGETGLITDVNPFLMHLLGYPKDSFIGRQLWEIGSFQDAAASRSPFRELQEQDYIRYEDLPLLNSTGERVEVEFVSNAYQVDHTKVIQCNIRDITAHKRAEVALRESERKLDRMLQTLLDGMVMVDLTGEIIYANLGAERILDIKKDNILGKYFSSREWRQFDAQGRPFPPDQLPLAIALREAREVENIEHVIIAPDGAVKWISVNAAPLFDENGRLYGAIAGFHDITEKKQAEKALQRRFQLREYAVTHTFDELLQWTIDAAEQLTSSRIGFFHKLDPDQITLTLQVWSTNTRKNMCQSEGQGGHYSVEHAGVWVDCIRQRLPVIHNDYASLATRKGLPAGHAEVIRELVVPIFRDERIVAILGVGNKPDDYDENDVQMVSEFANLAWDVLIHKQAEQAIEILARFPAENPNPVMRIGRNGKVLYANNASQPLLANLDCITGQYVQPSWMAATAKVLGQGDQTETVIQCSERIYSLMFVPFIDAGYVNLYGRDVTEQVHATEALEKERRELEARVQERTLELETTNEQLHDQISQRSYAEAVVKAAFAYNRSLIEASLDPLVTITPEGKIGDVNQATELVTGFSRDELIGTDFDSYISNPAEARRGYQEVLRLGTVRDFELEIRHRYGRLTPVLYNASFYRDETGAAVGIFAAARDITQLKKAQTELQQKEGLLRTVMENLPVGIWLTDATGKIYDSNLAGRTIWAGARYVDLEQYGEYKAWRVNNGKRIALDEWAVARAIQYGETTINEELEIECFDGSHKFIINTAIPLRDAQHKINGAIAVNQDITDIKRAQFELQAAKELIEADRQRLLQLSQAEHDQRLFAESLTRAISSLNSSLDLNEVLDSILEQIQTATRFKAADIALLEDEMVRVVRHRGFEDIPEAISVLDVSFPLEQFPLWEQMSGTRQVLLIPNTEKEPAWVSIPGMEWPRSFLAVSLQIGENVVGFINILSDQQNFFDRQAADHLKTFAIQAEIAIQNARHHRNLERLLAQEQSMRDQLIQAEKYAAMGRMLGSVAHELNNPLQTIRNCLFLTQQDIPQDSPIQEYLQMAFSEINRLSRIVAQLRELYRPPSTVAIQPRDICRILDEVQPLMAVHLQNQLVLWQRLPDPGVLLVNCDADQIKQVFINIGVNAIEAMQPDGGTITVQVIRSKDGRQAGVTMRDTGPGIAPEILMSLFEPFMTTKSGGLGLGLSICYELIHRHNGHIEVESTPGAGTVFTIWLPLTEQKS